MRLTSEVSSVCSECARTSFLLSLIAVIRDSLSFGPERHAVPLHLLRRGRANRGFMPIVPEVSGISGRSARIAAPPALSGSPYRNSHMVHRCVGTRGG